MAHRRSDRSGIVVWAIAVAAYAVAVAHRASLGVTGLELVDRFTIQATVLSLFAVVQLSVYAAAQLPVGLALDRFGSRRMIATGACLMALGQFGMAFATTLPLAITMRVLIGLGDAMTFVSVIRLVPSWFPPRRVPLVTQLTGIVGQLGQIIAAIPFVALLHQLSWTWAFTILGMLGLVAGSFVVTMVRDRPQQPIGPPLNPASSTATPGLSFAPTATAPAPASASAAPATSTAPAPAPASASASAAPATSTAPAPSTATSDPTPGLSFAPPATAPAAPDPTGSSVREALRNPGTWLGFWAHMVTSFSTNVFVLLWGYPFLISGQGLSPANAGALLSWNVVVTIVSGPIIGEFTARHPLRRSWAVIAISIGVLVGWLIVIISPQPLPLWALVVFVTLVAVGGPGSVIGFDYARSFNAPARLGAATGLVNVGGFSGAVVAVLAIGVILDAVSPSGQFTLDGFRIAFTVIVAIWLIAMTNMLVCRRLTRRHMADSGVIVPPIGDAIRRHRRNRPL